MGIDPVCYFHIDVPVYRVLFWKTLGSFNIRYIFLVCYQNDEDADEILRCCPRIVPIGLGFFSTSLFLFHFHLQTLFTNIKASASCHSNQNLISATVIFRLLPRFQIQRPRFRLFHA
jgi:hypothetical protein